MTSSSKLITLLLVGCTLGCQSSQEAPKAHTPLQPLIYTELPNLTPEAAEIRERRLVRELVDGQVTRDPKVQQPQRRMPVARDARTLGKVIFNALIKQDDALWDHAFVSPTSYSRMVHIKQKDARKFVDELMGKSKHTWELFSIAHVSEAPEGGLDTIYEFAGLELGQPRLASGRRAKKNEHADQYWGNKLKIRLRGAEVVFTLTIPKILNVVDRAKNPSGQPVLCVASKVIADRSLNVFVAAGLHLKHELLRSQEYPYPLATGNFWRYRRFIKGKNDKAVDPIDVSFQAPVDTELVANPVRFDATESLIEVLSVSRYRGMRLVKLRKNYNDQQLTTREFYWLMTPRHLYACSKQCVRRVDNMRWLLDYMQRQTPLFVFPLKPGDDWGKGISRFTVKQQVETVTTPAGVFIASYVIKGKRGQPDPSMLLLEQTQILAPGRGLVRLTRRGKTPGGEMIEMVEELVELRIMP